MKAAVAQFAASEDWRVNAGTCSDLIRQAGDRGADLLVLPEGVLARFVEDRSRIRQAAQPLDGPFVDSVAAATRSLDTTVVLGVHERSGEDVFNTLVVLRRGSLVARYRKLHLYDAFGSSESATITAGSRVPELVDCAGLQVGLMTCYDVRFPELARLHADRGADVLVVPAAWVRGSNKEWHWRAMVTARALENTCYVVASGECGPRNIGHSMVVDPLGIAVAQLGEEPGMAVADIDPGRIQQARRELPVLQNRRFAVDPSPLSITLGR